MHGLVELVKLFKMEKKQKFFSNFEFFNKQNSFFFKLI